MVFFPERRTKEESLKRKLRVGWRQTVKRRKSAFNNGDVNSASAPETLACCHRIFLCQGHVKSWQLRVSSLLLSLSLSLLHSPTHDDKQISRVKLNRGFETCYSVSCLCLYSGVISLPHVDLCVSVSADERLHSAVPL